MAFLEKLQQDSGGGMRNGLWITGSAVQPGDDKKSDLSGCSRSLRAGTAVDNLWSQPVTLAAS